MKQKKTNPKESIETADLRFKDSLPLQKYRKLTIGIAGLGAIGRQVAILLAAMGHKKLYGADPDKIELKNVGTQGWNKRYVGQYKAHMLSPMIAGFPCKFEKINLRNPHFTIPKTDVFFCCVDTMQAREAVWQQISSPQPPKKKPEGCFIQMTTCKDCNLFPCKVIHKVIPPLQGLWIGARMATRVMRVLAIDLGDEKARDYYTSTLYSDIEAFNGSCTDRMTMYGANIAAGLMVSQLANWLNEMPLVRDFVFETQRMSSVPIK